jgi:hypothetical protein
MSDYSSTEADSICCVPGRPRYSISPPPVHAWAHLEFLLRTTAWPTHSVYGSHLCRVIRDTVYPTTPSASIGPCTVITAIHSLADSYLPRYMWLCQETLDSILCTAQPKSIPDFAGWVGRETLYLHAPQEAWAQVHSAPDTSALADRVRLYSPRYIRVGGETYNTWDAASAELQ